MSGQDVAEHQVAKSRPRRLHVARLLRLDEGLPVRIPTPAEEAAHDLVRAREASRQNLTRARHRLSKLLLRHEIVYSAGMAWNQMYDRWLRLQRLDSAATKAAFDAYETALMATARRDRLDEEITTLADDTEFIAMAHRLACLRGISTLTGFALAVAIGDWDRFIGASIGAYLRVVLSEHSAQRVQLDLRTAWSPPRPTWTRIVLLRTVHAATAPPGSGIRRVENVRIPCQEGGHPRMLAPERP